MGAQFSPPTSHNFHWVFKAEWLRYQEKAENLIQCESIRNIWFERNEDQGLWYCYAKPQMGMVQMKSKHKSTKFSNKLIINSNAHWCFYLYQNSCHSVINACFSKFHLHINDCPRFSPVITLFLLGLFWWAQMSWRIVKSTFSDPFH